VLGGPLGAWCQYAALGRVIASRETPSRTPALSCCRMTSRVTGDMVDDLSLQHSDPALAHELTGEPDRGTHLYIRSRIPAASSRASERLASGPPAAEPGDKPFRVRRRDVWSNSWAGIKGAWPSPRPPPAPQPAPIVPGHGTGLKVPSGRPLAGVTLTKLSPPARESGPSHAHNQRRRVLMASDAHSLGVQTGRQPRLRETCR
jgi:hypothetical protein